MLAFRVATCFTLAAALGLVAVACGSDDSGSSGENTTPFEPAGNGQPIDEKPACEALKKAKQERRDQLKCGAVTEQPCPTYIQVGHEACSQYDEGTISGCVAFYASLPSCKELANRPCIVKALDGTAPSGCPVVNQDAGTDAGEDAGEDAAEDTGAADVTEEPPVIVDAGVDVVLDVAVDVPLGD